MAAWLVAMEFRRFRVFCLADAAFTTALHCRGRPDNGGVGRAHGATAPGGASSITTRFSERNMTSLKRTMIAGLLLAALPTAGLTQPHSEEEEAACRRDAVHFCRGLTDDFQVRDCLVGQKRRISHRCRQVLESHGF